jgi:hypothetical protein
MISPPKYEKKSVAYIDKTEIIYPSLVTTQEKNKVCKFYRISPAFIQSISNIPEDMKIYIHSNEYILHKYGYNNRLYLVSDEQGFMHLIEENKLKQTQSLSTNQIIDNIENILNKIK